MFVSLALVSITTLAIRPEIVKISGKYYVFNPEGSLTKDGSRLCFPIVDSLSYISSAIPSSCWVEAYLSIDSVYQAKDKSSFLVFYGWRPAIKVTYEESTPIRSGDSLKLDVQERYYYAGGEGRAKDMANPLGFFAVIVFSGIMLYIIIVPQNKKGWSLIITATVIIIFSLILGYAFGGNLAAWTIPPLLLLAGFGIGFLITKIIQRKKKKK